MQAARTPVPDAPPQDAAPATSAGTARRVQLIINARSGLARHEQLGERARAFFQTRGIETNVDLVHSGSQLRRVLERSGNGDYDVVIAAGGDGTISTVASTVADTGRALGIIPVGTFNFFAQRLGVPLDIDQALGVIADGRVERITVGEVNGRIFINNSSIGLYPTVLRQREATYRRVGRSQMAAYLSAAVALARSPAHMDLELVVDGAGLSRTTPLLFVGVNAQQLDAFGMKGVDCIKAGRLAMYITQPLGAPRLWKLGLSGLIKGFGDVPDLETVCGTEAVVTARRKRIRVAIDGELVRLHAPLRYRSRPDALPVIVPAS
jgi:diacylglycerol kinase family enzyme